MDEFEINMLNDAIYLDFNKFKREYQEAIKKRDINSFLIGGVNLLCCSLVLVDEENKFEKLKLFNFLLDEGIDVNFLDKYSKGNALHFFYFESYKPPVDFQNEVTRKLIEKGIDVNCKDIYGAIPLKYSLTTNKLSDEDNKEMYQMLIDAGSDYNHEDVFEKSCIDYIEQLGCQKGFLDLV